MVVLPYYLHDEKQFARITILGEFLAIASVIMCILFIFVDLGQPARVLNIILYPSPRSLMFWDMISLSGYLLLNAIIAFVTLRAEREETCRAGMDQATGDPLHPLGHQHPHRHRISLQWTCRPFLLAHRDSCASLSGLGIFFRSGSAHPALPRCCASRRLTMWAEDAIRKLAIIMTYAMAINVFFVLVEVFTVFYAAIPEHTVHFEYLYLLGGGHNLAPWMWVSAIFAIAALIILFTPAWRRTQLPLACILVFISLWLEKGLGLIVGGFEPSPLGVVAHYAPTLPEWSIVAGIWAVGAFLITVFYKIALSVREEVES